MRHGLPTFAYAIIPQTTKHLGRVPSSWREMRSAYEEIQPLAKFNPKLKKQSIWWRVLNNAEQTASFIPDKPGTV